MPQDGWVDPIVEEVHRVRQEYSARFNHDIDAVFEDLRQEQEKARREGRTVVSPPHPSAPSADKPAA